MCVFDRSAAILKYSGTEGGGNGDDDDSTMWSMVDLLRASDYEEFLDSEGPVLNALNYAPPSEEKVRDAKTSQSCCDKDTFFRLVRMFTRNGSQSRRRRRGGWSGTRSPQRSRQSW